MNDTITTYTERAERFGDLLARADGRWDAPTPCTDWTVRDLVRHVIDTERQFLEQHRLPVPPDTPDADPARAWRSHARAAVDALRADGVADRRYDGYFGPTTIGDTMADFYGWDLAVHAWDLARATGQDDPITDQEADRLSAIADGWGAALHSPGVCGPELPAPDDAGPVERLLARLGRDPHWTARVVG
jgi:uncharacterized protein (TIGR03086 family)